MKKVAYIFHGHSRTWEKCYENFFNNVHSVLPGDIFIHTWNTKNALKGSHWNPGGWSSELESKNLEISKQTADFNGIYAAYNPKVLLIEPNKEPDYSVLPETIYTNPAIIPACVGTKNMLYQDKRIFDIANAYGDYDYFFSTRLDVDYPKKLSQNELDAMLNENAITTPYVGPIDFYDVWCFGSKDLMEIKTDYYYYIDEYWFKKPVDFFSYGYERALYQYIIDKGVKTRYSELDFKMIRLF